MKTVCFSVGKESDFLSISLDKIVSAFGQWDDEKEISTITIDLVNGFSYQLFHEDDADIAVDITSGISKAIDKGSTEGTEVEDTLNVLKVIKIKTK